MLKWRRDVRLDIRPAATHRQRRPFGRSRRLGLSSGVRRCGHAVPAWTCRFAHCFFCCRFARSLLPASFSDRVSTRRNAAGIGCGRNAAALGSRWIARRIVGHGLGRIPGHQRVGVACRTGLS
jgi:hypothetical protein